MAVPMTSKQLITQLNRWGIKYEPIHSGWESHNRNHKGEWGPVHGIVQHHTGSDSQKSMRDILWSGYDSLPGPITHVGNDMYGKLWLAGWGRANHAGLGDPDVLNHVIREDYEGVLKPNEAAADGNRHFYGIENMYSGNQAMSQAQYRTAVLFSAAISEFHEWGPESSIGHGEWQPGKWDPGARKGVMMDMATMRNHIEQAIEAGPNKKPPAPKPNPTPTPTPAPSGNKYTVKKEDTIWSIAEKYLGDGKRWPEIVTMNPKLINVQPGEVIVIPKR